MDEQVIFEAAINIPDNNAREVFIQKASEGNVSLLARVRSLLTVHDSAGSVQEHAREAEARTRLVITQSDVGQLTRDFEPKEEIRKDRGILEFLGSSSKPDSLGVLGHYEVLSVLGQGGFGTVLKAFDEKLHRLVAIKMMSPELAATSPPRKRFLREARSAAAMNHENVVQIYNVEERPLPYLVMEFVAGSTLQGKMDATGPIDVAKIVHISFQIATGLAAAHAMGLIHRDIKPGNILLSNGVELRVKITDFGLARAADDASITCSGTIQGTPLYMSPEQALGGRLDCRSDLFSLGSVLYTMASGRPAFRAPTIVAVLRRVSEDTPRPLQEIIPEIPDWLVTIIDKLMAKKPEDRFQTSKEVADLLGRCQSELHAGQAVTAVSKLGLSQLPAPASVSLASTVPTPPAGTARQRKKPLLAVAASLFALAALVVFSESTHLTRITGLTGLKENPKGGDRTDTAKNDSPAAGAIAKSNKAPSDPDRELAEWVLSLPPEEGDRFVELLGGGGEQLRRLEDLPSGQFNVDVIDISSPKESLRITDRELERFGRVGKLRAITLRNLMPATLITDEGIDRLSQSPVAKSLEFFAIAELVNVTDASAPYFSRFQNLGVLNLAGSHLTDTGIAQLDLPKLYGLGVSQTKVTMTGLKAIVSRSPRMVGIGLKDCELRDQDLSPLTGWQRLENLGLDGTGITDNSLRQIARITSLERLSFCDCAAIDDEGIKHLESLQSVKEISLAGTNITDAGLGSLAKLKTLEDLNVTGCKNLTAAGVSKLQAALPKCKIVSDFPDITAPPR